MAYMRLGDLLVASGTITGQQLERALALQKETKQRLGDVLIQNGFITEAQLIDALRVQQLLRHGPYLPRCRYLRLRPGHRQHLRLLLSQRRYVSLRGTGPSV